MYDERIDCRIDPQSCACLLAMGSSCVTSWALSFLMVSLLAAPTILPERQLPFRRISSAAAQLVTLALAAVLFRQ
jgi:hypothetical protein